MTETKKVFLVIDDDQVFRRRLRIAIGARGFDVFDTDDPKEAIEHAEKFDDLNITLDLKMPLVNGLDLLDELVEKNPKAKVLILTGYGSISTAVEATRKGAIDYLMKPADTDEILMAFEKDNRSKHGKGDVLETPSLAKVEWEHIQRVLQECDGNISEAARRLGIHRRSLQRKLQKHAPRS